MSGVERKNNTYKHFKMKNKPKFNLYWMVTGSALDNALQEFLSCRDLSVIHLERKIVASYLNKGLLFPCFHLLLMSNFMYFRQRSKQLLSLN